MEDVARFPLVLLRTGFCTRELIDEGLGRKGIQADILAEFDSVDAIVSCVQEVAAISVLPEHAGHWSAYRGVKVIPLSGDRWKRSVGLVTPRVATPLPAVSCFVDFLRASQLG
jgi:DNA-binding transcriptional LysR family regulator